MFQNIDEVILIYSKFVLIYLGIHSFIYLGNTYTSSNNYFMKHIASHLWTHRLIDGLLLLDRQHLGFSQCLVLIAQHYLHDQTMYFNENTCFNLHEMVLVIVSWWMGVTNLLSTICFSLFTFQSVFPSFVSLPTFPFPWIFTSLKLEDSDYIYLN